MTAGLIVLLLLTLIILNTWCLDMMLSTGACSSALWTRGLRIFLLIPPFAIIFTICCVLIETGSEFVQWLVNVIKNAIR
jgi:hypothetical protein